MATIDFLAIGLYFVLVALVAVFSSKKSHDSSRAYFLGGGNIGWMAIGASHPTPVRAGPEAATDGASSIEGGTSPAGATSLEQEQATPAQEH